MDDINQSSISTFINRSLPIPLYSQLQKYLTNRIDQEEFCEGEQISNESDICQKYGVSRTTVRKAIQNMVDLGYLIKIHGKGTFVANRHVRRSGLQLLGFTMDMERLGKKVESVQLKLDFEIAPAWVLKRLDLSKEQKTLLFERIRLVNGIPLVLQKCYLAPHLDIKPEELSGIRSLYKFLRDEKQIALTHAEEILEAKVCSKEIADRISINVGDPILSIKRTTFDSMGQVVECVNGIYRGDLYEHHVFTRLN